MEAICKADYVHRVLISAQAEKEKARRKKEAEEAARLKRRSEEKGRLKKKRFSEPKESPPEEEEEKQELIVPKVGFHDIYGAWFFGLLSDIIRQTARERFAIELHRMMHVFVDLEPKKIADGVHDISVYGHSCRLYKWMAQGYHRGLVVLADDDTGKAMAQIYMESGTWSWLVSAEFKERLGLLDSSHSEKYRVCTIL